MKTANCLRCRRKVEWPEPYCSRPECRAQGAPPPVAPMSPAVTVMRSERAQRADIKTKPPTTVASAMRELAELRGEYDTDRRMADIIRNAALRAPRA